MSFPSKQLVSAACALCVVHLHPFLRDDGAFNAVAVERARPSVKELSLAAHCQEMLEQAADKRPKLA